MPRCRWTQLKNVRCFCASRTVSQHLCVARPLQPRMDMLLDDPRTNTLTRSILGAAIEVHRALGPGLLESTYLHCLELELASRGIRFVSQRSAPIIYKGMVLADSYRLDLVVEDSIVVEVIAV